MVFADDTEVALNAATALVNTAADQEALPDVPALQAFVERWGWTGPRTFTEHDLREVRALRPVLRQLWDADEDGVVAQVNALLREHRALPQLVRHGDIPYHLHAWSDSAPIAERMATEAAMAMADVVRSGELSRLRVCGMSDCSSVLVDLSKNRSKRYCDLNCSNRAAVTAYRARRAAG